jgi:hypothetical protein
MNLSTKLSSLVPEGSGQGLQKNLTNGKSNLIRRYIIVGERRLSNYWWASVIFLGACGFLYTGISAYLGQSLFNVAATQFFSAGSEANSIGSFVSAVGANKIAENQASFDIPFFPQGLLMSFYGSLGLLLSFYWVLLIFWNVGGGFNEFNKKDGFIRIFRWGYPGKNRKIDLIYSLKDVEAIRVDIKQGFDPQRTIYLRLNTRNSTNASGDNKGSVSAKANKTLNVKREIPLTGISQPLTLKEIEKQASELANFLQVSLEGL